MTDTGTYLLAGQPSELERLQLQSRVWEPAGATLLSQIELPSRAQVLDAGCGALGWLRLLSRKVGPEGRVTGTDIDERLLAAAHALARDEALANVTLERDDLFDSRLPPATQDLVHARFQLAPLGRMAEQVRSYLRWLKPGGWLVLEEPDAASWRIDAPAPATEELIELLLQAFDAGGGDFNAGRALPALMREAGLAPSIRAHVIALEPGHPYLRLPLQFAGALRPRLEKLMPAEPLDRLLAASETELAQPHVWGTTFTLIQVFAKRPA